MGCFDVSSLARALEIIMEIKNCLVTGGSGFIGQVLCQRLQSEGCMVRALLRRELKGPWQESVIIDLNNLQNNNPETLLPALANIDTLFHTAGIAHAGRATPFSEQDYWQVNVLATEQLLKAACQAKVKRFIYFSSVKVLSNEKDHYTHSKRAAEKIVLEIGKSHNIQVTILRPVLVYGPFVKSNLNAMIRNIAKGFFPPLPETHNKRSLVFVDDLVAAALTVANSLNANGHCYVVTDGQYYSTKQLYDAIREALNLPKKTWGLPFIFLKMAATVADVAQILCRKKLPFSSEVLEKLYASSAYSSEAIQQLGWKPKMDFYRALPAMIDSIC